MTLLKLIKLNLSHFLPPSHLQTGFKFSYKARLKPMYGEFPPSNAERIPQGLLAKQGITIKPFPELKINPFEMSFPASALTGKIPSQE
jgi:hypothetical protein